jgi:U3 small nucleolar RNA-associated protein 22
VDPSRLAPTQFYNASVRVDSLVTAYLRVQHDAADRCEAYRDSCLLGRVWLKQRGFSGRIRNGGFGNFEWAVMVALLLQAGGSKGLPAFSAGYSSYQLFKATLQYIVSKDLSRTPQIVGKGSFDFPKWGDGVPILFDAGRSLNILFKMTAWSWRLLQHEAKASLAALNDSTVDHFEATFISRVDVPLYRFDQLVEIPVRALLKSDSTEGLEERLGAKCLELYNALCQGLADRVRLVSLHQPEEQSWDVGSTALPISLASNLLVGLTMDPANANRLIDHGPAAEQKKEAASFRKFWGEKSELRRFKDGSILESLVWTEKGNTRSIFRQVLAYVLIRHFGQKLHDACLFVGDQHIQLLSSSAGGSQAGLAPFQPTMTAFQTLERDIRSAEGLPLQIRHIRAADPQLSYSTIQAPFTPGRSSVTTPADIILQFEGSTRWPDDLFAIQRTKVAFLLRLGELLEEGTEGVSAKTGLENQSSSLLNRAYLDVLYPNGAAFRIRIHHDREAPLLERRLKLKALGAAERNETATALADYKRVFLRSPIHTQAVQSLCTRFDVFSASTRLVKRWFSSHLLSPHFAPSLIELFVARAFIDPYPWAVPACPVTGFLRTLFFLSKWDWRNEPWIIDLSGESMTKADRSSVATRFEAWRKIDPALNRVVLFAASNVDPDGATWTDHAHPPRVVAARMTQLAKAATKLVKEQGLQIGVDMGMLFVSSLKDYDFLVDLNPATMKKGRRKKEKPGVYKNLQTQSLASPGDHAGSDLVRLFIQDLRAAYGETFLLFWDENDGDVIGGLWNPQLECRPWKLKLAYSSAPFTRNTGKETTEDVEVSANKEAILSEVARLGGDLISKVESMHTK